MNISLAVAIITSNRLPFLREAIQSVLDQTCRPTEIIVVVDGSKDGTLEYLNGLQISELNVIPFPDNRGRPAARTAAAKALTADALVWLDDDDAFVPEALGTIADYAQGNPDAEIIYHDYIMCDEKLQPQSALPAKDFASKDLLMHLVFENVVPNGGTLIRKSVFDKIGYYDSRFKRGQDYHFWMRAALEGCTFSHLRAPLYLLRPHEQNFSNPVNLRGQSKYQCMILQEMLQKTTIESIFNAFNWENEANSSAAKAMQIFAKVFFDHGDDQSALECIELAESFNSSKEGRLMKAMILRAVSRFEDSADMFAGVFAELMPQMAGMNVKVGALRGSEKVAAEAGEKND